MAKQHPRTSTRNSIVVKGSPEAVYAAFMDPIVLAEWLPPAEMTGVVHSFEPRVGGGYRMSLFHPPGEKARRGKTAEREDMVTVRFLELTPPHRIVEAITFVTDDPDLMGEMRMTATIAAEPGGSRVTLAFEGLPPGLKAEDNEAGARLSLEQLARRFA